MNKMKFCIITTLFFISTTRKIQLPFTLSDSSGKNSITFKESHINYTTNWMHYSGEETLKYNNPSIHLSLTTDGNSVTVSLTKTGGNGKKLFSHEATYDHKESQCVMKKHQPLSNSPCEITELVGLLTERHRVEYLITNPENATLNFRVKSMRMTAEYITMVSGSTGVGLKMLLDTGTNTNDIIVKDDVVSKPTSTANFQFGTLRDAGVYKMRVWFSNHSFSFDGIVPKSFAQVVVSACKWWGTYSCQTNGRTLPLLMGCSTKNRGK
jgi:hypothetical protein